MRPGFVFVWLLTALVTVVAFAQPDASSPLRENASGGWSPKVPPREHYRDILDFNIFEADRAALVREVERQRQPIEAPSEAPPPPTRDPDADYVLVGVALRGDQQRVFIEDGNEGGGVVTVEVPGDFSAGRITAVDAGGAVYRIEGEDRPIAVGHNLQGQPAERSPTAESEAGPERSIETGPTPPAADDLEGDPRRGFSRRGFRPSRDADDDEDQDDPDDSE
jgi:hypothetical protein